MLLVERYDTSKRLISCIKSKIKITFGHFLENPTKIRPIKLNKKGRKLCICDGFLCFLCGFSLTFWYGELLAASDLEMISFSYKLTIAKKMVEMDYTKCG